MHLLKIHDRISYQIKKGHRKGVEVKTMRIFKTIIGNDIRYVCAPKSTKVLAEYEIISDVTKQVKINPYRVLEELYKTDLSEPVKELIFALLEEHRQRIFGEV